MTLAAPGVSAPAGPRLLPPGGGPSYAEHVARYGELPHRAPHQLVAAAYEARLTGRGGAGFPVWRKLETALTTVGGVVVVGNAAEGEPASAKDRTLLTGSPQLVLDGLALVAAAVRATRVVLYAREGATYDAAQRAVAERAVRDGGRGVAGVAPAPRRFLAGEESAVANHLGGGPSLPRTPPVWSRGVRGRPTLVLNVETLAHLALLARFGPDWFAGVGDPEAPGSMLLSVSVADDARPVRVLEAPTGTPYAQVLEAAGRDPAPQAVLVGGYHGTWLTGPAVSGPATRAALRRYGATPGAGVVMALPRGACPLAVSARIVAYLAAENAGQCGPCVNGLPALAEQMGRLVRGLPGAEQHVARYAGLVDGRGGCHHPDGTAGFARSTLRSFAADVAAHRAGTCTARAVR